MVRKVMAEVPADIISADLEKYRCLAIELGARDARIISAEQVVIDERVRAKCLIPLCGNVGKSMNCPPNTMDLESFRKVVNKFTFAIFYMLRLPSDDLCGQDFVEKKKGAPSAIKNFEICSRLESSAFYDGYFLAMGFAGGPCGPYFCGNSPCAAMKGEGCRSSYRARPSMEAMGINAFLMAAKIGWDVYPIGTNISASDVPHGTKLGLVLIH